MARQFNLIPPVCEQAEYHLFQREKVEVQLPELYHKIGESPQRADHRRSVDSLLTQLNVFCLSLPVCSTALLLAAAVTGVGAMTWSPLACGIITGKYENGIPESSRASMKVGGGDEGFWCDSGGRFLERMQTNLFSPSAPQRCSRTSG